MVTRGMGCLPVIPALLEAEAGRLQIQAEPQQLSGLARPGFRIKNKKSWVIAQQKCCPFNPQ